MKRVVLFGILVVLTSIVVFALEVGAMGGMEMEGRNRPFIGAKLGLSTDSGLGLSLEAYLPVSSFATAQEEIEEARFVEVDPFLLFTLPIGTSRIYAGVAPILIYDMETGDAGLYSDRIVHAKVGVSSGSLIRFFIEVMSSFTYDPEIMSLGIYTINVGAALGL